MIIVSRNWLVRIGPTAEALRKAPGLLLSHHPHFVAVARYTSALMQESSPRTLVLVGLTDAQGAASDVRWKVVELCWDACRNDYRTPSPAERATLFSLLKRLDHPTARKIELVLHAAARCPIGAS